MDWNYSSSLKRKSRKKRTNIAKSTSEPNLSGHFTPRFPDNLTQLLHEYVSVDELKFYRKRRPPNVSDEFHSKERICLYDEEQPILPFAALKTEYTKEFGKSHSPRSKSVPNRIDLNATTKELLDALRDDNFAGDRTTAKISGEIEIDANNVLKAPDRPTDEKKASPEESKTRAQEGRRCMFKVQGELSYSPDFKGEFKGQSTMERSESIPRMNNIKFHGTFQGTPEYRDSYKAYNHFTKSAPIKVKDHLHVSPITVNTAVISPTISSLSEYTDKYKEINLRTADRRKLSKQISNVAMRNNLMVGHSDQHVFPEYFDQYQDPKLNKLPERPKARSPILGMTGSMDYNPEYRMKYTDFPRRRPVTQRPETHFDFIDRSRKSSPIHQGINMPKFNRNVAIVEPTNVHQPPTIDKNPFYLCQPEVRKARREILIKKRPPSPNQTISAAVRSAGRTHRPNEDVENQLYNERSRIVTTPIKPPIQVTIENVDEPSTKPTTIVQSRSPVKCGRRVSVQTNVANLQANQSKIIEGNHRYAMKKKPSLTSSTDDDIGRKDSKQSPPPSFVVLKDPMNQNKWMKSSWYM